MYNTSIFLEFYHIIIHIANEGRPIKILYRFKEVTF